METRFYSKKIMKHDQWLDRWNVLGVDEEGKPNIPVSRTKYEWQAGPDSRTNWENIPIQTLNSSKRGDYFPALVAMAQIPVVGHEKHITPILNVLGFKILMLMGGEPFVLGDSDQQSYKQLGNAVNVNMIRLIQERIDMYIDGVEDSSPSGQMTIMAFIKWRW